MRELGNPGVQESLDKVREVAIIAEIMETMKTPEWQENLENIAKITNNMNNASEKMSETIKELRSTGVIDEAKELIATTKGTINMLKGQGDKPGFQDLREASIAFREMLESIEFDRRIETGCQRIQTIRHSSQC